MLPMMQRVAPRERLSYSLIANRFRVGRGFILTSAWMLGPYHFLRQSQILDGPWEWPGALLFGLAALCGLTISGRRVTLLHRHFRYVSLVILMTLAGVDMQLGLAGPAIACLLLASCVLLIVLRVPNVVLAWLGVIFGVIASGIVVVILLQQLIGLGRWLGA
jgi:hypothetical protein